MTELWTIDRRRILKGAGIAAAGLAMPALITSRARAAEQITVADVGGAITPALRKAFYTPFEEATGIRVIDVVHESDPVTQFKLLVDTESFIWDVSMVTPDHVDRLTAEKNYLADCALDLDAANFVEGSVQPNWLGFSVFGIAMAFRTDTFAGKSPTSWADFWNVDEFPGRRGLYRSPWGVLECALLADGVPLTELYPLDVDRAFAKLDEIREHVAVWWTSGAQNTQVLQSGEGRPVGHLVRPRLRRDRGGLAHRGRVERGLFDRWLVDPGRHAAARGGTAVRPVLCQARAAGGLLQRGRERPEQQGRVRLHHTRAGEGAADLGGQPQGPHEDEHRVLGRELRPAVQPLPGVAARRLTATPKRHVTAPCARPDRSGARRHSNTVENEARRQWRTWFSGRWWRRTASTRPRG